MHIINKNIAGNIMIILLLFCASCKKFVQIPAPKSALANTAVFSSDATANAAQLGVYALMPYQGTTLYLSYFAGWSSDELNNYSTSDDDIQLYSNSLTAANTNTKQLWTYLYNLVYQENSVIEGVNNSTSVSDPVKKQLLAEAKFTRAFLYFYLTNLYGDVPLTISTSYASNNQLPRSSQNDIYSQMIADLKDAAINLNTQFVGADGITPSSEKLRPTKYAAQALLARVYLYNKEYETSELYADSVITSNQFQLNTNLSDVFKKNSLETILAATINPYNTYEGITYILTATPSLVAVSPQLLNSFEGGDERKNNWISNVVVDPDTFYFPFKYQHAEVGDVAEYTIFLRLAEQYLIRAEARARQNKFDDAILDINVIRSRANLSPYGGNIGLSDIMNAIMHERQVELFTEWGNRWLDLKRTGAVDSVMTAATSQKGGVWNTNQQLYPIPQADRNLNANLTQNTGY